MLPTKFLFIWPSGFRGEDFLEINQSSKLDFRIYLLENFKIIIFI